MLQQFNQKNRDLIVNIDGRLVHRDEAGISPFDSVVQAGDAVWEGLRLYNGRIFKLYEHLDRLHRSAVALSFREIPPREKIIEEIKRTLAANRMRDGVHIRLTLTRGMKITSGMDPRLNQSGPTLIVLAEHKAPVYAKTGLTLITSNTRATVIEICAAERIPCVETDLTLDDVYRADEIFCTGTMGELAGVIKVDDRLIGDGKVGLMTRRLNELYAQRTAAQGIQVGQ